MRVLLTGSSGFIGRHCLAALLDRGFSVDTWTHEAGAERLEKLVGAADVIIHLAGVNRPPTADDHFRYNAELSRRLAGFAAAAARPPIIFASSTQALGDSAYGVSKRQAEEAFASYEAAGGSCVIFRLPNVFGPGSRPNYNSVVATFGNNAARGLPLDVHDPHSRLVLVYVQDVVRELVEAATSPPSQAGVSYRDVSPVEETTVGNVARMMEAFAGIRRDLSLPDMSPILHRQLYATFLSFIPRDRLAYNLPIRQDARGALAEVLKTPHAGQLFVSRTKPGVTRGNHFHLTKTEKFIVVQGSAVIRLRSRDGDSADIVEYAVKGDDFRIVDIPPNHAHSITNTGTEDLVVLFWASEVFDPYAPDTHPLDV